jgi:CRISPR-associated exonuclease Cas4
MSAPADVTADTPHPICRFAEIVEQEDLHGLAFQHLSLCRRRAWLHLNRIDYAHLDERMAKGRALHDVSRPRDRTVQGLMGLSPDRIDWQRRVVHEGKGGAGAVAAVSCQTAFYALMLWAADGRPWSAATDILPSKRSRPVSIDPALIDDMLRAAEDLRRLKRESAPPKAGRKPICAACSYRFLCGHT